MDHKTEKENLITIHNTLLDLRSDIDYATRESGDSESIEIKNCITKLITLIENRIEGIK